ncbi:MAG TPA: 4-(cytidine 5'-diphospho)-2-C-methyl-D-erythritol kinase, partial [Trebonia sp.]|nr:4-(cytidine 5'-diphospho)-2-C-methyl-D-erythritol kinase [Trebonia sp.]
GLVTVFHAISLFDELTVAPAESDSVTVTGEHAEHVPETDDNLALRAVRQLRKAIAERGGVGSADVGDVGPVAMAIGKQIPVAGGMAGGSADAAAALVACNELWHAGLATQELCDIGARVGSDVAFAVIGGTAVGRGRGEQLTPVPVPRTQYHWVLAIADGHLSTPKVYGKLDEQRAYQEVPAPELSNALVTALATGNANRLATAISNDLQEPAIALFPDLRKTLNAGRESGALAAQVSGSGPTCFFLASDEAHATHLAASLSAAGVCRAVTTATGPVEGASVVAG